LTILGVGKDVLSYCNKCKLTLSHIVVVMKDVNTPGKVQCNTCRNTHAFKDPALATVKKKTRTRKTSKKKASIPVSEVWEQKVNAVSQEKSEKYTPKKNFNHGDIIDHPNFGVGLVEKNIDKNKIEVLFRSDIKILIHNMK